MSGGPARYGATVAPVACNGETHRVRFEGGELHALDHDDPEGERGLAVLGGTSCPCADVLAAWSRRRRDHRLLVALSRGPGDPVAAVAGGATGPRRRAPGGAGWVAYASLAAVGPAAGPPRRGGGAVAASLAGDAVLLAGLGRATSARLVGTVTAGILERLRSGEPGEPAWRASLHASLYGRACEAVRCWLGDPSAEVDLDVVADPSAARVTAGGGPAGPPTTRLALPLSWVAEVWGRDLGVVAGRLSLRLLAAGESGVTVEAAGAPGDDLAEVTVHEAPSGGS